VNFITGTAEKSEVGIYNPAYFQAGTYTVTYRYDLHPPVEYDDEHAHLNIRLVNEHVPYRDLSITYPEHSVAEIYPHPPGLRVDRTGGNYVISGRLAADEILGLELLLSRDALQELDGFPAFVSDVAGKTRAANPPLPERIPLLICGPGPPPRSWVHHPPGRDREGILRG
jgi:hypothetical protein